MAFTRALGGRSLEDGLRVVGVNAGPVSTDRVNKVLRTRATRELGESARVAELMSKLPLGRPATVTEVVNLCVYLASPCSSYTTGVIFTLDGGATSRRSIA
jgi:NAD(P)-dependent dehydrogenase (short-subunit alcohol dehydrogenase family)